jgi:hypothetical protein
VFGDDNDCLGLPLLRGLRSVGLLLEVFFHAPGIDPLVEADPEALERAVIKQTVNEVQTAAQTFRNLSRAKYLDLFHD